MEQEIKRRMAARPGLGHLQARREIQMERAMRAKLSEGRSRRVRECVNNFSSPFTIY